jgi:hypothetical protein
MPNLYASDIQGDFNDSTIDSSGYGSLSAAEKNQTYFAYFSSVGSTTPEIIEQTSYFVKYLIDAQGNVVSPQPNSIDLTNMLQNFEPGKLVNVTSLEGTTLFNTLLGTKQISHVGKIETLMTTETGSGKMDYVRTMSYAAGPGGISEETAYNYAFHGYRSANIYSQDIAGLNVAYNFVSLPCNTDPLDVGGNYNNSTYQYTFPNSTTSQGTLVQFTGRCCFRMFEEDQVGKSNWVIMRITKQTGGTGPWEVIPDYQGQTYRSVQISMPSIFDSPQQKVVAYTTPYMNFNTGDKVRVEIALDNGNFNSRVKIVTGDTNGNKTEFYNRQDYVAVNQVYTPYWSIGTYTTSSNQFTMITASTGLTGMSQNQYSQVIPTASDSFGFNDIYLPFVPQPGDFIRFEYNPSKVHTIHENTLTDDGRMALKIVPSVPTGSILDHFCVYRVNPNAGNQIILNIAKPTGSTGQPLTGFIKPLHMSKELEDNFTTIVQKLAAEGTIQ